MRCLALGLPALVCIGCSATISGNGAGVDAGSDVDAALPPDAPIGLGPWGTPQKITIAAQDNVSEDDGTLSYSGLELVFAAQDPADNNRKNLFYASRPDAQSPFGPATLLPFSAVGTSEETPRFSADDKTLFFAKTNGTNSLDIFQATRDAAGSTDWGAPTLVAGVNSTGVDKWYMPCGADYLMIVGSDIGEGTSGNPPVIVDELSSANSETGTFLTKDCLTAYFASTRGDGINRMYTATRASLDAAWSAPVAVEDFAALGGRQQDPFIANDDRTFVFVSDVDGTNDVYISTR